MHYLHSVSDGGWRRNQRGEGSCSGSLQRLTCLLSLSIRVVNLLCRALPLSLECASLKVPSNPIHYPQSVMVAGAGISAGGRVMAPSTSLLACLPSLH